MATPRSGAGRPGAGAPVGLRADAVRNRERILAAARECFAEYGLDISMAEVARRAGVGLATAFRRFPTEQDLIAAVFAEKMAECDEVFAQALVDPDPAHGFDVAIRKVCALQAADKGLSAVMVTAFLGHGAFAPIRREAQRRLELLLRRAQQRGSLREDIGFDDFILLLKANAGVVSMSGADTPQLSQRLVDTLLRALRAPETRPAVLNP